MTGRWRDRVGRPAAAAVLGCLVATLARAAEGPDPAPTPFLADVPLATLDATRERPIFLPSRRAPQAVVPVAAAPLLAVPVPIRNDEPPRLTLLGIIRAPGSGGSAVVMDETDHTSVSLKPGESRRGWVVRSIGEGTVTVEKQDRSVSLSFMKAQPAALLPAE